MTVVVRVVPVVWTLMNLYLHTIISQFDKSPSGTSVWNFPKLQKERRFHSNNSINVLGSLKFCEGELPSSSPCDVTTRYCQTVKIFPLFFTHQYRMLILIIDDATRYKSWTPGAQHRQKLWIFDKCLKGYTVFNWAAFCPYLTLFMNLFSSQRGSYETKISDKLQSIFWAQNLCSLRRLCRELGPVVGL